MKFPTLPTLRKPEKSSESTTSINSSDDESISDAPLFPLPPPNERIRLTPEMLPTGDFVIFRDSTFFSRFPDRGSLPLPHDVRAEHLRTPGLKKYDTRSPPPVRYRQLNLVVKFGSEVTIAEGQCLWALRKLLSNGPYCVPVPEIYGWRTDGDQVFIYQELIAGVTLADRWNELEDEEKQYIIQRLKDMTYGLRLLEQDPSDIFIGHIGRQKLLDKTLPTFSLEAAGPFRSVKEFHDWFFGLLRWKNEPYRSDVPDDAPIVFTHADFDPSNIIVPSFGRPEILALVDWHGAGWYPAYWEYSKAIYNGFELDDLSEIFDCNLQKNSVYHNFAEAWHYVISCAGVLS